MNALRPAVLAVALVLLGGAQGCMLILRPPVDRGMRINNDRYEVAHLNRGQLSVDQRRVLSESGTPKFIVFEKELETGKSVQRWVYPDDKLQYVFLAGKKVDYVVVESAGRNPLLEAAQASDQGPLMVAWQWLQLVGHWVRD